MPNKIYINPETSTTWTDAGGDKLLDLGGLAANGTVMGALLDLGATARAEHFMYELTIDGFNSAPVVGESVMLYLAFSNATTNFDGNPTTDPTAVAQGTITVDQLRNVMFAAAASVYSTTAADELKISGVVDIPHRYVSPVIHNDTTTALLSMADAHKFVLTPVPYEVQ